MEGSGGCFLSGNVLGDVVAGNREVGTVPGCGNADAVVCVCPAAAEDWKASRRLASLRSLSPRVTHCLRF